MGAASFTDQMAAVKQWLDTHPDQVVITIVEDHTKPDETAAALEAAGLADRAWTLDPTAADADARADDHGRQAICWCSPRTAGRARPPWYQSAYSWFQETPYTWKSVDDMNCSPNRGSTDNKLMLVNHWIAYSPPDPGRAGTDVNSTAVLNRRIEQCINERGVLPTVLAADFAERGNLVKVVADYNHHIKRAMAELKGSGRRRERREPRRASMRRRHAPFRQAQRRSVRRADRHHLVDRWRAHACSARAWAPSSARWRAGPSLTSRSRPPPAAFRR